MNDEFPAYLNMTKPRTPERNAADDLIRGVAMSNKLGISPDQISSFCRRWMVAEMALFGSVLRDDFRPDSDIDVLVDFSPEATWSLFDISRMRLELSSLFGREVDLVQKGGLRNPYRRRLILTNRKVIYAA